MDAVPSSHIAAQSSIERQSLKRGVSAMSSEPAHPSSSPKMPRFTSSSHRDRDNRSVSPPSRDSPLPHRLPPTHPPLYNRIPSSRDTTPTLPLSRDTMETRPAFRQSHSRGSSGEMTLADGRRPGNNRVSSASVVDMGGHRVSSASFVDVGGPSRPQQSKATGPFSGDVDVAAFVNGVLGRLKNEGVVPHDVPGIPSSDAMDMSSDDMEIEKDVVAPLPLAAVVKVEPVDASSTVPPSALATEPQAQKTTAGPELIRESTLVAEPIPTPQTAVFAASPTVSAISCLSASLNRRLLPEERTLPREFGKDLLPALVKAFTVAVESRIEWDSCRKDVNRLKHCPSSALDPDPQVEDKARAGPSTEPLRPVDPRKRKAMEAAAAAEAKAAEREARKKADARLKEADLRYQETMSELDNAFMSVHKVMRVDLESLAAALQTSFEASRIRSQSPAPALGLQIGAPSLVVDANAASYVNEDRLREIESYFQGKLEDLENKSFQAFSSLDGKRMELAETFDDKFVRLSSVFVKPDDLEAHKMDLDEHKRAVHSLEERVERLAGRIGAAISNSAEVDKVGARLTSLEKRCVTDVKESERCYTSVNARVAAIEKEWRLFDPFDKSPGEVIDVNDARHSLRTKLKNMDSNLTMKTEFLETAVDQRITQLESTYDTKIDTMGKTLEKQHATFESTAKEKFSKLEGTMDTKVKDSETRFGQWVEGVENKLESRVDSTASSWTARFDALQASMNQQFLDMAAENARQLGILKEQVTTLVADNQSLRKAWEEERDARLSAKADAERVIKVLKDKVATLEEDTLKMQENAIGQNESLDLCWVDVLGLKAKYDSVAKDANSYHLLRRGIDRTLAEVDERQPLSARPSFGAGSNVAGRPQMSSPQRASVAGPPSSYPPKVENRDMEP
ncbi:hypothetical protein FRC05_004099 [Tulasnella sp. 425]|nr:hypothetical protein FRC05_004099 [Tulasnella sp. 425]